MAELRHGQVPESARALVRLYNTARSALDGEVLTTQSLSASPCSRRAAPFGLLQQMGDGPPLIDQCRFTLV